MKDLSGVILLNRFRLDQLENRDDLGDFYAGVDLKRNIPVSIHLLSAALPYDASLLAFQSDNITLQTLTHAHIAPFYGLYQGASGAPDEPAFLVERYVDGPSLHELLLERRGRPVSIRDAIVHLKALCSALGYAQGFGLVHCNVSPAHIHVADDGSPLLGGFGFARKVGSMMTSTGLTGPPIYLAPEIIRRETIWPATDIYGIGITLFELLTGQHPFLGARRRPLLSPAVEQLIAAHLLQEPADPRQLNPAIPTGLADVILTALKKDPAERYQHTQEMLEIACAVTGYTPNDAPERLILASTLDQTLYAFHRPESEAQPPPGGIPPHAEPPLTPAVEDLSPAPVTPASGPQAQPTTPVQPDFLAAGATAVYSAPVSNAVPAWTGIEKTGGLPLLLPSQKAHRRAWPIWLAVIAGLFILLCTALLAVAGPPLYRSLTGAPAAGQATPALLPSGGTTATIFANPLEATPSPTSAPPSQTPRAILPGMLESPTPTASVTPLPTRTSAPTATPPPPTATRASWFTVTIRNNTANPFYAFRDGRIMGTDPIPPARYIYYKSIPPGAHTFSFCLDLQGRNCFETRHVTVEQDLTITVP